MSIQLSPQYGVNPALEQCFVCMKDVGVVLFGRLRDDAEAPRKVCLPGREPCDECKGYMEQGVILISVDESKTDDPQNPWRSGGWIVVRDAAIKRLISNAELRDHILKKRVAFIPDQAWDALGFPRGEQDAGAG